MTDFYWPSPFFFYHAWQLHSLICHWAAPLEQSGVKGLAQGHRTGGNEAVMSNVRSHSLPREVCPDGPRTEWAIFQCQECFSFLINIALGRSGTTQFPLFTGNWLVFWQSINHNRDTYIMLMNIYSQIIIKDDSAANMPANGCNLDVWVNFKMAKMFTF